MPTMTVPAPDIVDRAPIPRAPMTIEETGIRPDQLSQLMVKTLYTGEATGRDNRDRHRLESFCGLVPTPPSGVRCARRAPVTTTQNTDACEADQP